MICCCARCCGSIQWGKDGSSQYSAAQPFLGVWIWAHLFTLAFQYFITSPLSKLGLLNIIHGPGIHFLSTPIMYFTICWCIISTCGSTRFLPRNSNPEKILHEYSGIVVTNKVSATGQWYLDPFSTTDEIISLSSDYLKIKPVL